MTVAEAPTVFPALSVTVTRTVLGPDSTTFASAATLARLIPLRAQLNSNSPDAAVRVSALSGEATVYGGAPPVTVKPTRIVPTPVRAFPSARPSEPRQYDGTASVNVSGSGPVTVTATVCDTYPMSFLAPTKTLAVPTETPPNVTCEPHQVALTTPLS